MCLLSGFNLSFFFFFLFNSVAFWMSLFISSVSWQSKKQGAQVVQNAIVCTKTSVSQRKRWMLQFPNVLPKNILCTTAVSSKTSGPENPGCHTFPDCQSVLDQISKFFLRVYTYAKLKRKIFRQFLLWTRVSDVCCNWLWRQSSAVWD